MPNEKTKSKPKRPAKKMAGGDCNPRLVLRRGAIKAVARELCRQHRIDPDAMEPGQVRGKSDVTLPNGDPANAMWKYHTDEAKRIIDVLLEYLPQNDQCPSVGATETDHE